MEMALTTLAELTDAELCKLHRLMKNPNKTIEYDFAVYGVVKYFQLCMDNNPNMIDSLFVPRNCVLHSTEVGEMIRENRRMFLHKGAWHKFKGYAYAQASKIRNKVNPLTDFCAKHKLNSSLNIEMIDDELKKRGLVP
jgi:hypothetical protein